MEGSEIDLLPVYFGGLLDNDDFFIYFNLFSGMFVSFLLGWVLCKKKYQLLFRAYKTNPDTIQTIKLPKNAGGLDDSENKVNPLIMVPKKEIKKTIRSTIFAIIIKSKSIISIHLFYPIKRIKNRLGDA